MNFLIDRQFWAAILAAFVVWTLGYFFVGDWSLERLSNPFYFILLYPIVEELAFRGLIQGYLREKFPSTIIKLSLANVLTSIIFTALHLFYNPVFLTVSVLIPSLIFGYFKDRTGSVLPAISLHIFYNLGYFLLVSNV